MKKIILLIGLITLGVFSTKASSLIIIISQNVGSTHLITLNNQTTYQTSGDLTINNLIEGDHSIYIVRLDQIQQRIGYGRYSQIQTSTRETVVFDGSVNIPSNSEVFAYLSYNNLIISQIIQSTPPPIVRSPRGRGYNNENYYGNRRNGNYPMLTPMADIQFSTLLQTVENESFDNGKLDILGPVLTQNYFSSNQILQLIELFSFDNKKLEVAKLGYANTLDKGNYFVVNNGLTFSSNKKELSNYILNYGS